MKAVTGSLGFSIADGVEFSSEMARRTILHFFPAVRCLPTSVVTHQGVDVTHFTPQAAGQRTKTEFVVGYAGRIDARDKALRVVIDATEKCRQKLDSGALSLAILGTGPDEAELRHYIKDKTWVRLVAPLPMSEVPGFLHTLDLFVLPSRIRPDHQEHDAHALLQAAACGIPTIATASGINSEIVGLGVGALVAPDDMDAMAAAIHAFVTDNALRKQVSERSRRVAETHFAVEAVALARNSLYEQVVGKLRRQNAE
jgi:glycosyltransferase involved in cell wall biosynthesis